MEYIVSARKYRPMTFDAVVGQSALTTTLKNAVKSGKLAHAFLFCGPRGVGKTTCARIFAKAINCENPSADGEACGECESCRSFDEQRSFNIFELDAASNNSVEDIKNLMDQTRVPPQTGNYKVFIIDEVHMLSAAAFNAFLKTLEEPPSYVIFILATTEKQKLLPTIISRCQIYDFERMTVANTISHLKMVAEKEGVKYEEEALQVIAEKADGGMRDALSIFDQCASFCQNDLTYAKVIENLNVLDTDNYFQLVDLCHENKVPEAMLLLDKVLAQGFDGGRPVVGLSAHIRNVLMAKDESTAALLQTSERHRQRYKEQAKKCDTRFLYGALKVLNHCDLNYRQSSNKRLLVELAIIETAQLTQDEDVSSGRGPARRLKSLFKHITNGSQALKAVQGSRADRPLTLKPAPSPAGTPSRTHAPISTQQPPKEMPKAPPTLNISQITNSLSTLGRKERPSYLKVEEADTNERQPFTQDDVQREWMAMCVRMQSSMPGPAARLKQIIPQLEEPTKVMLVADNPLLMADIQGIIRRIRATLAQALHNGDIQVEVRLAKSEETSHAYTRRELYDNILKENPAIEQLRQLLDLELA